MANFVHSIGQLFQLFGTVAGSGVVQALLVLVSAVILIAAGLLALYLVLGGLADLVGGDTGYVDGEPR